MIKLTSPLVEKLLNQPESGMGYQLVEVSTTRSERKTGIAYNADLVLLEGEIRTTLSKAAYESFPERDSNPDDHWTNYNSGVRPICAFA